MRATRSWARVALGLRSRSPLWVVPGVWWGPLARVFWGPESHSPLGSGSRPGQLYSGPTGSPEIIPRRGNSHERHITVACLFLFDLQHEHVTTSIINSGCTHPGLARCPRCRVCTPRNRCEVRRMVTRKSSTSQPSGPAVASEELRSGSRPVSNPMGSAESANHSGSTGKKEETG